MKPDGHSSALEERAIPGLHEAAFATLYRQRPPPASVIDLGAGSGAWANRLSKSGYSVTAVERDGKQYRGSAPLVIANLNRDFAHLLAGPVDVVTCLEVIEHVENPRHLLRESRTLLAQDGMLLVTTPNFESVAGRLRFLWTGELRHFGRDPRFNEPTHISPLHTLMFERAVADAALRIRGHRFNSSHATGSRWPFLALARLLRPMLRGALGGDNHIYVLEPG
jgi:SAM-dependent methyltransferase